MLLRWRRIVLTVEMYSRLIRPFLRRHDPVRCPQYHGPLGPRAPGSGGRSPSQTVSPSAMYPSDNIIENMEPEAKVAVAWDAPATSAIMHHLF